MTWKKIWDTVWTNGLKRIMEPVGKFMAAVVNGILLGVVFVVGVGLTSIIGKVFGKQFLEIKKNSVSYWDKFETSKDHERMF